MIAVNPQNQFIVSPSGQAARDRLAYGGLIMNVAGCVAQIASNLVVIQAFRSERLILATIGTIAMIGFSDIRISGRNMERLMKSPLEREKVAKSPVSWEIVCTRWTMFLGLYCRLLSKG
jgi:hypothetical protein